MTYADLLTANIRGVRAKATAPGNSPPSYDKAARGASFCSRTVGRNSSRYAEKYTTGRLLSRNGLRGGGRLRPYRDLASRSDAPPDDLAVAHATP